MTLREYIIFWQETYDSHQSRPTTYAAHNYVFKNHILPGLGDIPLSELTSEMVGEFLEERRRFGNHRPGSSGLGEETMRHIHRLLQQCLDQAIRDGLLTENPAKAFRYRKSTTVKANIMTPLEMEDYLDAAEQLGYTQRGGNKMKNRIIITATFAACLALCAAVWPQAETVGETPTPSETTAVIAPQPTLPEAEKPVLPVVTEKKETEMPETKSAPETTTEELPVPAPEIEDEPVAEQKSAPPTQTDPTPVQPAQLEPKTAPESIANDNELADMVYVPGFGWIQSEGPNHVEYAEDMYENGNKIGTMG